jgi:predicted ATP-grasp superfamily ATP-dependent carboligase
MTPIVIVLDGEQRAALAVVRSLGRHGCQVHVGSAVPKSIAGGSRFTSSETILPDPLAGADDYCSAVHQLTLQRRATVLLPVTEASTLAILEHQALFRGVSVPTSDLAHFRRASDKAAVLSLAHGLGMEVPKQWTVAVEDLAEPEIPPDRFPVVVKPSRSVVGGQGSRHKTGVAYAKSPAELAGLLAGLGTDSGPILIQERIEGPGFGIFLLRWEGKIIASFAHRRVREKPPSGGVSVCCESIGRQEALLAQASALLDALDWTGVAMIEYKHETRSGRDCLMEVNPRFWGSLQLAIDAGVDFPWYLTQAARGEEVTPVHHWRVGLRSRWVMGEIDHLIARLRHSRTDLDLPSDAPGLFRTVASILIPWRPNQRNDVFRVSDPIPALREVAAWIRAL